MAADCTDPGNNWQENRGREIFFRQKDNSTAFPNVKKQGKKSGERSNYAQDIGRPDIVTAEFPDVKPLKKTGKKVSKRDRTDQICRNNKEQTNEH